MSGDKAADDFSNDLKTEYNVLAKRVKESESEIDQLEKDKRDISTKQAALTRLTSIINMLMEAGFDGMSFEQKRDFLLLLYPFGHKTYNIKVWRINKTDYRWEARGKLTDKTIEGFFQSADGKGKPVETTIQCIVDQPITEDEKKLLDKHRLTDKTLWYNSDIRKVRKLLNLCVTDNNFYDLC